MKEKVTLTILIAFFIISLSNCKTQPDKLLTNAEYNLYKRNYLTHSTVDYYYNKKGLLDSFKTNFFHPYDFTKIEHPKVNENEKQITRYSYYKDSIVVKAYYAITNKLIGTMTYKLDKSNKILNFRLVKNNTTIINSKYAYYKDSIIIYETNNFFETPHFFKRKCYKSNNIDSMISYQKYKLNNDKNISDSSKVIYFYDKNNNPTQGILTGHTIMDYFNKNNYTQCFSSDNINLSRNFIYQNDYPVKEFRTHTSLHVDSSVNYFRYNEIKDK